MNMGKYPLNGLILAGGLSTRMGTDKALLLIAGKPLIYQLVQQLSGLVQQVIISVGSAEREAVYRESLGELGAGVIFALDRYLECGPLSGLHAGLSESSGDYVFVMACDMPTVSEQLLSLLLTQRNQGADVIHCSSQPFHALYHTSIVGQIEEALKARDFRVMGLLQKLRVIEVTPQDYEESYFVNLNTPDDYRNYIDK